MQTAARSQGILRYIPLSLIVTGTNPRRHFDAAEMAELTESVRQKGVIQAISVRPAGDKFQILAGERRFRAALAAHGETYEIGATVTEVDDDEAEAISLTENIQRAAMSASEESDSAARVLSKNRGDLEETAKELGWPLNKLSRRLGLQNLSEKVKEALNTRAITVGHAEILASVPIAKQDAALSQIIEHGFTVSFVRENLLKKVLVLAGAIFNQEGCAGCQFNTSRQQSLFTENLGIDGSCTNADCYHAKEVAQVETIRLELAEEFPHTRILSLGDTSFATLTEQTVGAEQFSACKGCGDYGAAVSTSPGSVGKVAKSLCFSLDCRKGKIADLAMAVKDAAVVEKLEAKKVEKVKTASGKAAKTPKDAKSPVVPAKVEAKPTVHTISNRIKEYRRGIWNIAAKRELAASPDRARAFIIDLAINNLLSNSKGHEIKDIYQKLTGKAYKEGNGSIFCAVFGLHEDIQVKLLTAIAVTAIEALSEEKVKQALDLLEVDLAKHFFINKEFLGLLTKSELESLCSEIQIDGIIAGYSKVKVGKRDDFIKSILGCGFDFTGVVPQMLNI